MCSKSARRENPKRVIIVSKTHLDLGFTDYAESIKSKYFQDFLPTAIKIAKKVNYCSKKFVWMTGSWLLHEALNHGNEELRASLIGSLEKGDIVAHALPFTTHTELLDEDTLEYALSLIDDIDKITGKKTISAKMTDVPGHTIALVPFLAKKGIKLLHIGVNSASAIPDVPECFLWKKDGYEIIVIYSGDYGGEFTSDYIDDILFFDHTIDNIGTRSAQAIVKNYNKVTAKYPSHEVIASSMDYIAEKLWSVKNKLPIITSEIGDSWIHGVVSDPYKVAAMKELQKFKRQLLDEGKLHKSSEEYRTLSNSILSICEHTWGLDMKTHFGDYENYLRKDFDKARKKDIVKARRYFRYFHPNYSSKKGSYSVIEKSWLEQRNYITQALAALSEENKVLISERLNHLLPTNLEEKKGFPLIKDKTYKSGNYAITLNNFGGIKSLFFYDKQLLSTNDEAIVQFHSYGKKDYEFWFSNYSRDLKKNKKWAYSDFGRPLLQYVDKKYKQGRFDYLMTDAFVDEDGDLIKIFVNLEIERYCFTHLGAPKKVQVIYILTPEEVKIQLFWLDKPANRLTESLHFNLYPCTEEGKVMYKKINTLINPYDVVRNGNRNLSVVEEISYSVDGLRCSIINHHSPLVGLGKGKILQFDNIYENISERGISYILYNNIWGTNFPLWYEGNARFEFSIKIAKDC